MNKIKCVPEDQSVADTHIFEARIQQEIDQIKADQLLITHSTTNKIKANAQRKKYRSCKQKSVKSSLSRQPSIKESIQEPDKETDFKHQTSILEINSFKNQSKESQMQSSNESFHAENINKENISKQDFERPKFFGFFDQNNALKVLIKKQKAKALANNFLTKLKRNIRFQKPGKQFEFEDKQKDESGNFLNWDGFKKSAALQICMSFLDITVIVLLTLFFSLALVYKEVNQSESYLIVQVISFSYLCIALLINFLTIKDQFSEKIIKLKDIWMCYIKGTFWIDFSIIFIIGFDFAIQNAQINYLDYLKLLIIFKWSQLLSQMEKLEIFFIKNFYNEQYYSLVKVFLFNFCIAHVLAIWLQAMTSLSPSHNWMTVFEISEREWYIKYIWSYYFGTTIMLTVGFGDISASNHYEAVCIILIETFTCIVLAYNVNCVGNLINNLRSHDNQKSKNKKIFKKLSENNTFSEGLSKKINNTIEESVNLKKKFNVEEEKRFVENLPLTLKKQYLKQSNKQVFEKMNFFKSLAEKTLFRIAEKIEMRIAYPEETVKHLDDNFNLIILKKGSLGYMCKKNKHPLNDRRVNSIQVKEGEASFLTSFDFIHKKRDNFEIKSLEYTILYFMNYEELISALAETETDYENYCVSRDKMHVVLDEFQVIPCENCTTKHNKFNCPKIHYLPFEKQVIQKYLYQFNHGKTQRKSFQRARNPSSKALLLQRQFLQKNQSLKKLSKRQRISDLIKANIIIPQKLSFNSENKKIIDSISHSYKRLQQVGEIVKEEFSKMQKHEEEDNVWTILADKLFNYRVYFSGDNANNLEYKFDAENRTNIMTKYKNLYNASESEEEESESAYNYSEANFY